MRGLCVCGNCGIEWPLDPADNAKVDVQYAPEGFDLERDRERFVLSWRVLPFGLSLKIDAPDERHGPRRGGSSFRAKGVALIVWLLLPVMLVGSMAKTSGLAWVGRGAGVLIATLLVLVVLLRPFRNRVVLQDGVVTRTMGPLTRVKVSRHEVASVEVRSSWFGYRVVVVSRDQRVHELAAFGPRGNAEWFAAAVTERLGLQRLV